MTLIPPIKTHFLNIFCNVLILIFIKVYSCLVDFFLHIHSKHWMKKLRSTLLGGKNATPLIMDLAELTLWNWPSYWKQHRDSIQYKSKSLCHFSIEIEKEIYVFIWNHNITNAILSKRSDTGSITIPDRKVYYRRLMLKPG